MLYIDVNKLNHINETYGHLVGDALIKEVGMRLHDAMQSNMTAARLTGDKFIVVIDRVPAPERISGYCDTILRQIAKPYQIQGLHLTVTFSIGTVVYPRDGANSDIVLRRADTALSAAKLAGPNQARAFEIGMNSNVVRFTETRNALRLALERHEFEMYYQPQIDLRSGKVVGAEALLRWNRPDHGMVAPGKFIDVAEDSGLIIEIGKWVLDDVCRQATTWSNQGLGDLTFSVNVSAVQFRQSEVAAHVHDALANNGLNPANLELELTESIFLQSDAPVLSIMADWKARGIKLAIDDFGTGYSSLQYLKRLKIDKLKIDQSFVRNLTAKSEDYAIVQAIIQMALALKLKTIAEGVEDQPTIDQLKQLGCDQAQGYWFARPMSAARFFQWFKSQQ
jgi:diguanylate cyclase (GGDEF)-like protein